MALRTLVPFLVAGLAAAAPTAQESKYSLHVRRQLLGKSTLECLYDPSTNSLVGLLNLGCDPPPSSDTPACKVGDEVAGVCALGDNTAGVTTLPENRFLSTYAFDHCQEVVVYVSAADSQKTFYCRRLATTGDWSERRRETAGDGVAESSDTGWWGCGWWGSPFMWHDGQCRAKKRFLGEACWDEGECHNSGTPSHSGLHMSCATMPSLGIAAPTCIPSAFEIERNSCQCGWFNWWAGVACGAADGACNGHPCVFSTGPGGWMCDYHADNTW